MKVFHSDKDAVRSKRPRRRSVVIALVVFGAALAVAVPVAWATFTDVPPSNPFYDDINAIQGAGITQGCGGGNFCPTDNITRQAEAAFVHRQASRAAQTGAIDNSSVPFSSDFPTDTVVAHVPITVGGIGGGTQFAKVEATVGTEVASGTAPFLFIYYLAAGACTGARSPLFVQTETDTVLNTNTVSWVFPAGTGTATTYDLCAFSEGGTSPVTAIDAVSLNATTSPFGSTGAGTLGADSTASSSQARPTFKSISK